MKKFEEDKELKSLLNSVKLESPGHNFTVKVMNRIFQENSIFEKLKRERVLGKGFWIILSLFVVLLSAIVVVSYTGMGSANETPGLLSSVNTEEIEQGYRSLFSSLGTVPLSIAGILLASSMLLFIDRLISSGSHSVSK